LDFDSTRVLEFSATCHTQGKVAGYRFRFVDGSHRRLHAHRQDALLPIRQPLLGRCHRCTGRQAELEMVLVTGVHLPYLHLEVKWRQSFAVTGMGRK